MAEFNVRSDHIDVEQIMRRIRARIQEKRGVDYTEAQVKELAGVRLERLLDPKAVRSDLPAHYRQQKVSGALPPPPATFGPFSDDTVYASSRGGAGRLLTMVRRVLNPVLRLFINPKPIVHALHLQHDLNSYFLNVSIARDELHFEILNNLVVETTRLGIEVKNLKMRVESLSSRLDFDERRARALESVVQYRPPAEEGTEEPPEGQGGEGEGRGRRRRRRRGRRRGGPEDGPSAGEGSMAPPTSAAFTAAPGDTGQEPSAGASRAVSTPPEDQRPAVSPEPRPAAEVEPPDRVAPTPAAAPPDRGEEPGPQ